MGKLGWKASIRGWDIWLELFLSELWLGRSVNQLVEVGRLAHSLDLALLILALLFFFLDQLFVHYTIDLALQLFVHYTIDPALFDLAL